jgi:hypothetical protein
MTQDTLPITPNKAQHPIATGRSPRESTLESADQAAGIYSLYGDGAGTRDSWLAPAISGDQAGTARRASLPRTPLRNSITENELEEIPDEYTQQNGNGDGRDIDLSNGNGNGNISRSSTTSQIPTPEIRLTPSKRQPSDQTAQHPNLTRLSPSPRHNHPLGGSTTSNTSSMSTSRLSSAGSSQYPGEEEDAFHVRSTCRFVFVQDGY